MKTQTTSFPGTGISQLRLLCMLVALTLIVFMSVPVFAQEEEQSQLPYVGEVSLPYAALSGLIEGVYLSVQDNVVDGCWTNARSITATMESTFEAADIEIGDDIGDFGISPMFPRLDLVVTGERLEGTCLASAQMVLHFTNNTQLVFGHAGSVASIRTQQINIMWMNTQALAAPDTINDVIEPWATSLITQLTEQIATLRENGLVTDALATWGFDD